MADNGGDIENRRLRAQCLRSIASVAASELSPIAQSEYTYLSPQALGQNYAMGLLVRNDVLARFGTGQRNAVGLVSRSGHWEQSK